MSTTPPAPIESPPPLEWAGAFGVPTRLFATLGVTVLLCLIAFQSITRTQLLSPDSMTYIDAAQNAAAGRGLTQSVLVGYGERDWARLPLLQPLTIWAPLYPCCVAVLVALGIPAWMAALLVPVVALALFLVAMGRLTARLFNEPAGWLAVAALTLYQPVFLCTRYAWSEMPALAGLAWGFWWWLPPAEGKPRPGWLLALAGTAFGLAFAARYALLPAVLLAAVLLWRRGAMREALRQTAWLLLPAGLLVGAILIRNYAADGTWLGPPRPPSTTGLIENTRLALYTLFFQAMPPDWTDVETVAAHLRLWSCLLVVCLGLAFADKRLRAPVQAFSRREVWAPLLWALAYLGFMVVYRSRVELDPLGPRLLAPGLVFLIPAGLGLLTAWIGSAPKTYRAVLAVLLTMAVGYEAYGIQGTPPARFEGHRLDSPRLRWIAEHTTERDLIVGDSTMDVPVYCGFRHTLCLLPGEQEAHLDYAGLKGFVRAHASQFDRVFIVLRAGIPDTPEADQEWRRLFGPFIADLVYGRFEASPGVGSGPEVRLAHVFDATALLRTP